MRATCSTLLTRRSFTATVAAVAASVASGCSRPVGPATPRIPDQVTYLTNFGQLGRDAYSYHALKEGFFADARLTVTIEPGAGTAGNLQALAAGQAQFAAVDLAGAIISRGQGVTDFTIVAAIQQRNLSAVMTLDPKLSHPLDLAGRTVGLPAGAVTELLFPAYVQAVGLAPGDVTTVPMEGSALIGALVSGQVDAIGQFVVGQPLVAAAADGRPVTVLPYDEYLGDMYGVCLLTTPALADSDPSLCARFRDALLGGLVHALDHPELAGAALARDAPAADPEIAAAELRLMAPYVRPLHPSTPIGGMDATRVMKSIALLESIGALVEPDLRPEDLVRFDLLPQRP